MLEIQESSIAKTVESLTKNNYAAVYYENRSAAIQAILDLIPASSAVGVGGSWTINQLELLPLLEQRNCEILNHNKPGLTPEEVLAARRRQLTCDVFLTSVNAITEDGKLINTDGVGNRIAAMTFGPGKVIIIAGINKIVTDVEAAYQRIQTIAAPLNNKRLNKGNPCMKTGTCMDCKSPARICNLTTVFSKRPALTDTHIVLIGEELGY